MNDRAALERQFHELGLQAGDRVVVHSSLRAIGPVDGGAETVVAALLGVIGPAGLLVTPAFNFRETRFDPDATPSRMGRITEVVRTWPGAERSWHPTHSVAAIGPDAAALCEGHHLVGGGLSPDSPLDRLAAMGGLVLLLGVGHNRNSTVHVGEARAGVPHLHLPYRTEPSTSPTMMIAGRPLMVEIRDFPGCSEAFGAVEGQMRRRKLIRDGAIGDASAQLMRGADLIDTVVDLISDDPGMLLCTSPHCYRCVAARKLIDRPASPAG